MKKSCLILLLVLHGCAGRGPYVPSAVSSGVPLSAICARYNVSWQWDGVTQVVILEYKGNKAKALVGSNVVVVGKEKIALSLPLHRSNSAIYVPEDFEAKVLAPFGITPGVPGAKVDWSRLKIRTVILDPGHGGKDPGARGPNGVREKDVVIDIAKRMKVLLEQGGLKVIMTRNSDYFISLGQRTEIASRSDADLFVSIHANSNPARKAHGMEVYYVKTRDKRDLDEEQRQKNEKIFTKTLNTRYSPQLNGVIADMMYASKTAESLRLAELIARDGSAHADTANRGARACRFFVVRNTLVPAVLVEVGFLSNRREEKKLNSSSYRQRLAEAIVRSIINYATD
ncbi:MAG: N-acetylmuramoyl-L-alanine amidase [Candidatus Omnitrophica bacterium]|nr:N-acetylmuramoyl-L-alanine amidase [Candidatus Omnitrophota bacterium]